MIPKKENTEVQNNMLIKKKDKKVDKMVGTYGSMDKD